MGHRHRGLLPALLPLQRGREQHSLEVCDRTVTLYPQTVRCSYSKLVGPKEVDSSRLGGDSVGSSAGGEQLAQSAKKPAQLVHDQAQVVAGATEERMDRVASHHIGGCGRACSLHVADYRFERRLSSRRIVGVRQRRWPALATSVLRRTPMPPPSLPLPRPWLHWLRNRLPGLVGRLRCYYAGV